MNFRFFGRYLPLGLILILLGCNAQANLPSKVERVAISVEVQPVSATDLTETIEVVGSLEPKFSCQVQAEYPGIVEELYITEWVKVKKGQPLARLDTREIELNLSKAKAGSELTRAGLLQATVNNDRANREYERALKLKEYGLITQQNFDDIASAREAAASGVAAAQAQVKVSEEDVQRAETILSKANITAPMDGVVSFRGVNVGDLTGQNPLFKIVDISLLDLTVTVPSGRMSEVKVGQALTFTTDAIPNKTFSGTVKYINPAVDSVSRAVKVVAEVENKTEELKASLFVRGNIVIGTRTGVKQIPRQGLLSWDTNAKQAEVLVVEGDIAHRRQVSTGVVTGDVVEIVSGLEVGEKVIVRGGFNVQDGGQVKVQENQGA